MQIPIFSVVVDVERGLGRSTKARAKPAENLVMGPRGGGEFGFDKLDVYQRAIEFIALAAQIIAELPASHRLYVDEDGPLSVHVHVLRPSRT